MSAPDVLPGEAGLGAVHAEDGHERVALHAVARVEGAHGHLAEVVHQALDEHVAEGDDGLLDDGRDAQLEAEAELRRVEDELAALEAEDGIAAEHVEDAEGRADRLGNHGRHRDAHDAPAEAYDEPEVEHGVQPRADEEEVHARARIAHGAQYARHGVVHILEDEPHGVDGEILNRVLPAGLVGDAHEPHDQQPRAQGAEERERRAYRGLGYEQRARRAAELMLPARAVELRYEDAAAIRKAQGYGQEEEDERGAGAHRGEHRVAYRLRLAAVAADHYAVHRVV